MLCLRYKLDLVNDIRGLLTSSNGKKMPPAFPHPGLKIDAQDYIESVLKPHVLSWIQVNYPEPAKCVFMQDGALCDKSKVTQQWVAYYLKFWPKNISPPNSPDLNPLDFSIWAI